MKSSKYDPILFLSLTSVMAILGVTMVMFADNNSWSGVFENNIVIVELVAFAILLVSVMIVFLLDKTKKVKKQDDVENQNTGEDKKKNDIDSEQAEPDIPTVSVQPTSANNTSETTQITIDIQDLHTAFLKSEERISIELKQVNKRAYLNLVIGSAIAVVGIVLLFWFVIVISKMNLEKWELLNAFLPRFSIVLFVELFSYFFLKLYRDSLDRIKYYQNELTNIESKKIAILTCVAIDDSLTHKNLVIEYLLKVERNCIFKKGETSLELEKVKQEGFNNKSIVEVSKELAKIFKLKD